ncbi:MAG: hypothetical protein CFE24_06745 [Flavobacterium sp. BFFFF2]|nr:MAG: hypothetical protein CFE24_06745 [Flavobacterium sp. BFFFF2]
MIVKKLGLLFLILCSGPLFSQWIAQNSGVTTSLNDVFCVTDNQVFVVGDAGVILKTTDGGTQWVQKPSGTTMNLSKVQFINANVGFALAATGTVFKTIDVGETWTSIDTGSNPTNVVYNGLSCIDENTFYVMSADSLRKTTNGGAAFETKLIFNSAQSLKGVQFLTAQIGYVAGSDYLFKTIDGGNNWTFLINSNSLQNFYFVNETVGIVYDGVNVLKTTDGGANFAVIGQNDETIIYDLFAVSEEVIWESTAELFLCNCSSYCLSKRTTSAPAANQLDKDCYQAGSLFLQFNALYFANSTTGFAVGTESYTGEFGPHYIKGAIYKNATGVTLENPNPVKTTDWVVFPNPASQQMTISFSENQYEPSIVEIADVLGNIIFTQNHDATPAVTIPVDTFAKGVYFLTVMQNNQKNTQKILIE